MRRIAKVVPKEPLIPELRYLVLTPEGATVWNGSIGIRFDINKIGSRLAALVKQHKGFAIMDALRFLQIVGALDKVDNVRLDLAERTLVIDAQGHKAEIRVPVITELDETLPHSAIPWHEIESGRAVPVERVWLDATELVTTEGATLWGDVVGVYDTDDYTASFDYGVLLYHPKKRARRRGKAADIGKCFCPFSLLQLGVMGMQKAVFTDSGMFLVGDGCAYYTTAMYEDAILQQLLSMRDKAKESKAYEVTPDFGSGVWKRAKLFNKVALRMTIRDGVIRLIGNNWQEDIGKTSAPDQTFVTRISLLARWTVKTTGHKFYVTEDGSWLLGGITRKGSEFYGSLTDVGGAELSTAVEVEDIEDAGEEFGEVEGLL